MKGPLLLVNFLVVIGSLSTTTLAQEEGEQLEGIVIPLEKRQVLDSSNGVVDWARVQGHIARVHKKFTHADEMIAAGATARLPGQGLNHARRAWEDTDTPTLEWTGEDSYAGQLIGIGKRMVGSLGTILQDDNLPEGPKQVVKEFLGFRGSSRGMGEVKRAQAPKSTSKTIYKTGIVNPKAALLASSSSLKAESKVTSASPTPSPTGGSGLLGGAIGSFINGGGSSPPSPSPSSSLKVSLASSSVLKSSSLSPSPSSSATTISAVRLSSSATASSAAPTNSGAPKAGNEALTSQQGVLWAGTITIGTPPVNFLVDFDTGSADLWVPSINSSSPHVKYDNSKSSTGVFVPGNTLSVTYGDGSSTSGTVWKETISMAGITAVAQGFGAATKTSAQFNSDPTDGLMGMGYQSISQMRVSPFFQTLVTQSKVPSPQFSFKLSNTGAELYIGGMNPNMYVAGSTNWYPLQSQSYWVIPGGASVNGGSPVITFSAIIDSGTTVIVAPTTDAQKFWAAVPGSAVYGSGYYTYNCNSPPALSFSFGTAKQWTITPALLSLGTVSLGSTRCVGSIVGQDIGVNAWILGDRFMSGFYSTFDFGGNRVGFSTLA